MHLLKSGNLAHAHTDIAWKNTREIYKHVWLKQRNQQTGLNSTSDNKLLYRDISQGPAKRNKITQQK